MGLVLGFLCFPLLCVSIFISVFMFLDYSFVVLTEIKYNTTCLFVVVVVVVV